MSVKIGINPLTWTNDDMPSLGGDTPLETCLAEAKQAGYAGVELGNKFPREAKALKPILDAHGLKLASGWYGAQLMERSPEVEIASVEKHLALLAAMGSPAMVFCDVSRCIHGNRNKPLSKRPKLRDNEWKRLTDGLNKVAAHLKERGVPMAYHHHMGTLIQTEAEIDRLMAETGPDVGLLLDTGHLTYAGGDPVRTAKAHAKRIRHVHCKDVRGPVLKAATDADRSFLDAVLEGVFTVPGDGMVDFPAVTKALAAGGYKGWLIVEAEQDPAKAHPLTYATMGYKNLAKAAKAAGLMG